MKSIVVLSVLFLTGGFAPVMGAPFPAARAEEVKQLAEAQTREFSFKLKDVDALLFQSVGPSEKGDRRQGLVTSRDEIERWLRILKVEIDPATCALSEKGDLIVLDTFCQCWGDFEVSAFASGRLVGRFSAFHHQSIRGGLTDGGSLRLSAQSLDLLYHLAESVGIKSEANQSLEPTPTAGTSAAEQPLVPAAVVAHL